ncbi:hypothetical protein EDB19DRAFT_1736310 [Suillus lakei]|nr:hypothetical protein EDB19DRAFT_1736310 [Suillus lakei]
MYLPWSWPWFGFLGMFLFLSDDFRLTPFTKFWPALLVEIVSEPSAMKYENDAHESTSPSNSQISVTMILVLREALIWIPLVLVCTIRPQRCPSLHISGCTRRRRLGYCYEFSL